MMVLKVMLPLLYSTLKTNTIYMGQCIVYLQMNNKTTSKILAVLTAMIALTSAVSTEVQALPIQEQQVNANDIQPQLSYQEVSELLQTDKSFEDIEGLNLQIENTNIVAVYSNEGANGNFVYQYMVELKA